MGASRRKRDEFLKAHPTCIFCGNRPATTIDHVPSRECFVSREAPEGFEFPACHTCNSQSSQHELVSALYIRLCDHTDENFDFEQNKKHIAGVKNNAPEALPNMKLRANQKRKARHDFPMYNYKGIAPSQLPLVGFPDCAQFSIEIFGVKLGLALAYREYGKIYSNQTMCFAHISPMYHRSFERIVKLSERLSGVAKIGSRRNKNIGNQLRYSTGSSDDISVSTFFVQFAQSVVLWICFAEQSEEKIDDLKTRSWVRLVEYRNLMGMGLDAAYRSRGFR